MLFVRGNNGKSSFTPEYEMSKKKKNYHTYTHTHKYISSVTPIKGGEMH